MRTESFESSANSRTPKGKGASMHQTFFLFLTATVGLLIALALALAAFLGEAAASLPGEPISPAPIVKADKPIVEVMAGEEAVNTGSYSVQTENPTSIVLTSSRGTISKPIFSDTPNLGTWRWSTGTECPSEYLEYPVTITARDLKTNKAGSTTFTVKAHARQVHECPGSVPTVPTVTINEVDGKTEPNFPSTTSRDRIHFSFTSSPDTYSEFSCKIDETAWELCSRVQGKWYYNLADGLHTFQVKAKKPNSTLETEPDTHTFTVNKPPPVIFLPGAMGSKLSCGEGEGGDSPELWPSLPNPQLLDLRLQDDGVTEVTDLLDRCPTTRVSGVLEDITIDTQLFGNAVVKDFYKSGLASLRTATLSSHVYVYPYDWRKSPEYATEGLDQLVDQALRETRNDKVVILAHSMGGLVTRHYIDDPSRAKKVERAVTLGTPYWGSPKAWSILAHGQTMGPLDLVLHEEDVRHLARNSSGLYTLFPSDSYHNALNGWLTYKNRNNGLPLDVEGTMNAIAELDYPGGNRQLAENARLLHNAKLDSFATDIDANGRVNGVDYRVLVGTGSLTPTRVTEDRGIWQKKTSWQLGNGDETVPLVSAKADAEDKVDILYTCVAHDELGQAKVVDKLVGFLFSGSTHTIDNMSCGANGHGTTIYNGDMDGAQVIEKVEGKTTDRRMPLKQAEAEGLVDVIEGEGQTLIVTNDHTPVSISVSGEDVAIEDTRVENSQQLDPVAFAPTDGEVTIRPGDVTSVKHGGFDQSLQAPPVEEVPLDKTAPLTTVDARRSGESFFLTANAQDDSGVQATYYRIGEEEPKKWEGEIEVPAAQLGSVRFGSVDVFGNNETERTLTVDTASPKVSSATPANNATGVKRNTNLTATFSEKMNPLSLTNSTFQLFKVNTDGSTTQITNVNVTKSTDGLKATLNPFGTSTTLLAKSTKYKAVVTTGAKDVTGNPLDQNSTTSGNQQMAWSFKTGLQ